LLTVMLMITLPCFTHAEAPPSGHERVGELSDVARAAMQREAAAREAQWRKAFTTIKRLPVPAVAPMEARAFIRLRDAARANAIVWVVEEEEPAQEVRQDDKNTDPDDPEAPEVVRPVRRRLVIAKDSFDRALFEGLGDPALLRTRLDGLLAQRLDQFERSASLTPAQRTRLRLAGRGDIKRLFDQVDAMRTEFEKLRFDPNKCLKIFDDLVPLRAELRSGPFGGESLFSKTLKRIQGKASGGESPRG
jgi:hypothetical protein